jgi:hypothetical protein
MFAPAYMGRKRWARSPTIAFAIRPQRPNEIRGFKGVEKYRRSPDASVPKGRLKIGRDAILDNLQPSLRDLIMFDDVPRTSVLG